MDLDTASGASPEPKFKPSSASVFSPAPWRELVLDWVTCSFKEPKAGVDCAPRWPRFHPLRLERAAHNPVSSSGVLLEAAAEVGIVDDMFILVLAVGELGRMGALNNSVGAPYSCGVLDMDRVAACKKSSLASIAAALSTAS